MDFKKKFNYDDINIFLPDNITMGTTEFYQSKYPTLPEVECMKLEILSRVEYDETEQEKAIKKLVEEQLLYNQQLEQEMFDREQVNKDDIKTEEIIDFKDSLIEL